jgi:hypothetical protein
MPVLKNPADCDTIHPNDALDIAPFCFTVFDQPGGAGLAYASIGECLSGHSDAC